MTSLDDPTPTRHEVELAEAAAVSHVHAIALAKMLAGHREDVLRPFIELRKDFEALGDERVVRLLDELINAARGLS